MNRFEIQLNEFEKKVLNNICKEIYKNFSKNHVDIFLCGGDLTENTIRKKVKTLLQEKYIMIFYPEKVFVEYFNLNKNSDYLALETLLAQNVDYICIVCESSGSLVELGAFSNIEEIRNKIIALNDEKYKKEKSFVNLGPIKHLLKYNKNSVKFYNDENLTKICDDLKKMFRQHLKISNEPRTLDKITGMFYFICLLLYFFKSLEKEKLLSYLQYVILSVEKKEDFNDLEARYYAAEKILFNENLIKNKSQKELELTEKAKKMMLELINKNENIVYNNVISDIIKLKYYHYSS